MSFVTTCSVTATDPNLDVFGLGDGWARRDSVEVAARLSESDRMLRLPLPSKVGELGARRLRAMRGDIARATSTAAAAAGAATAAARARPRWELLADAAWEAFRPGAPLEEEEEEEEVADDEEAEEDEAAAEAGGEQVGPRLRKARTYWAVFFGRRDSLSLRQVAFWGEAVRAGLVDRVHLWNFTRARADERWLRDDLARLPYVRAFWPPPLAGRNQTGGDYKAAYAFYARALGPRDVLLKVDDDVVWLDSLPRLRAFLAFRRARTDLFVVAPSIVNNGVAAHHQAHRGCLDGVEGLPGWFGGGGGGGGGGGEAWGYPLGGYRGELWQSPAAALALHKHFLSPASSLACFRGEEGASPAAAAAVVPIRHRFSIGFVALLGRHAPWAYALIRDADCGWSRLAWCGDEFAITEVAGVRHGARSAMFLPFVVAHATFKAQDAAREAVLKLYRVYYARLGRKQAARKTIRK